MVEASLMLAYANQFVLPKRNTKGSNKKKKKNGGI
jgi:hypothetical protein